MWKKCTKKEKKKKNVEENLRKWTEKLNNVKKCGKVRKRRDNKSTRKIQRKKVINRKENKQISEKYKEDSEKRQRKNTGHKEKVEEKKEE